MIQENTKQLTTRISQFLTKTCHRVKNTTSYHVKTVDSNKTTDRQMLMTKANSYGFDNVRAFTQGYISISAGVIKKTITAKGKFTLMTRNKAQRKPRGFTL